METIEERTPEVSAPAEPNHLSPFELEVWVHKVQPLTSSPTK
jgi:hypothetical protein